MKNVVIIGGGTGLSVMLRGMKTIPGVELSAIVTVADDGGSTGRLPMGFWLIRSVIPVPPWHKKQGYNPLFVNQKQENL